MGSIVKKLSLGEVLLHTGEGGRDDACLESPHFFNKNLFQSLDTESSNKC